MIQLVDHIAAIERAEERHLEMADVFCTNKFCLAYGFLPFVLVGQIAAIDHLDRTVVIERIVRRDLRHTALEGMIQPGNLVPGSQITGQLKPLHRADAFRRASTGGKQ